MTWTPDHLAPPTLGGHLYGELNYLDGKRRFRITGDASMMQVARRMFPGADVRKDHLSFVHTRRVAEDLNWFLLRFPLRVLCPEKLEEARQQAIEHVRRRTTNDDLTPCDPPASFLGNLFTYQSEGVTFLNANERCVLADGMGLGKTWTALGAVAARGEYPVLIVVQPQVQRQWQRQVGRLFDLPCTFQMRWDDTEWTRAERRGAALAPILRGNTPYQIPDTPFTIIHYGLLRSWHETLLQRKYRVIIWDEIQELRHTGTAKYSAASLLSSEVGCSWGLSGTPVYGYGSEIWSVMNIIDFQCLGSSESFSREWCTGYGERIVADPDALGDFLRREGLLLRRRWQEVRPQLPRVIRRVQDVEHDEGMHAQLMQRAVAQAQGYGACHWRDRGRVARDIDRQSRHAAGVSKAHAVAHFVRTLIAAGERPLVFAWHHDVHDILIEALAEFQVSVLTGRETEQAKDEALRRFSDGRSPVALLSLRTAAGVDGLQERATCAVMAELDWAPAVMGQCETRVARVGAPKDLVEVPSYYCISETGYDQVMLDVLGLKTEQFCGIMGDAPESAEERRAQDEAVARRIVTLIQRLGGSTDGVDAVRAITEDLGTLPAMGCDEV
jgi:SWI/SNF-related matrix-associated actin-dependent regulator of chromatin subfamily A-like protein 1